MFSCYPDQNALLGISMSSDCLYPLPPMAGLSSALTTVDNGAICDFYFTPLPMKKLVGDTVVHLNQWELWHLPVQREMFF